MTTHRLHNSGDLAPHRQDAAGWIAVPLPLQAVSWLSGSACTLMQNTLYELSLTDALGLKREGGMDEDEGAAAGGGGGGDAAADGADA